jgi:peptidoglycan-N-acetylglucosamine deacetylase
MLILIFSSMILSITLPSTCTNAGLIALTFDDGPTEHTKKILDLAKKKKVVLSFHFTVHMLSSGEHRGIYKRAVKEGHTVGLRTTPNRNYGKLNSDVIEGDITKQIIAINKVTGKNIKFARSPVEKGKVNQDIYNTFLENDIIQTSYNYGYPEKNKKIKDYEFTISTASPDIDSFIVSLYETVKLSDLKKMIDIGREYGYKFVNLDQCLGDYKPGKINAKGSKMRSGGASIDRLLLPMIIFMFYAI